MHKPTRAHVRMLKSMLKYLNSHRDTPLVYRRANSEAHAHFRKMANEDPTTFSLTSSDENYDHDIPITGFTDADYAKSFEEQRKSTSGYAFYAFGNLVSWKSKLQPLTAGSTHEAELIALSYAADEGVWLRRLLKEIKFTCYMTKPVHYVFPQKATAASHNSKHRP